MTETTERLQTGTATIPADASFDDGPFTVHGVAQASEVTRGVSGQPRFWPPDVLADATDDLVGTPIVDPDDHSELDAGQPHPDIIIGEVTEAAFDDERAALVYEGEIDDPDRARQIARGRVDVSPSVALRAGDEDPERDAERVDDVLGYRDLAIVADGAHASASIHPGTAEALARHFDALQSPSEANGVDVDVSPPPRVVNAAEAAQTAAEDGLISDSCGTGVGDTRMEQIINDDLQPADFVTRFNGRTPVPAYLTSHEGDTTTDDPPTEWGEDEWSDGCGNAQQAKWGWYTEWAQRTANEVMAALDEDPIYEGLQRQRARTPTYQGTQDEAWSTPTLDDYLSEYATLPAPDAVDSVGDLSQDERSFIASKSLLGTPSGETLREVRFFPVVDPASDELNRRALGAVRSGRGEQADIPADALASAQRRAGELLIEEFDSEIELENMADISDVSEDTLVRWNSSGDRPAYGRVVDVRAEGDEPLDGEIDGDQTIQPPAALIELHRPSDGEFEPTETMVGHTLNTDTLTVIDELPDPESLAKHRGSDDGPHGSQGQSTPADDTLRDPLMDDINDNERELLARARQMDDPEVVEAGVPERLAQNEELLDEAESAEDPVVVESTDYDALQDRVDEVRTVLEDALQDRTGLSDTAIEAMPFEALAAEFETDDGNLDVEALTQSPETGSGPTDTGDDSPDEEDLERLETIRTKLDTVGSALPDSRVEALRDEAATIADADDYEAALEVL